MHDTHSSSSSSISRRSALARVAVAVGGATAVGGAFAQPRRQPDAILIGQSAGLTGGQAAYSRDVRLGIESCFAAINAAGGIAGRKIELVSEDDQGKKDLVAANTRKLIETDHVFALMGYTSGAGTEGVLPALEKANVPMLSPCTGNMGIRAKFHRHLFHTRAGYREEMRKVVDNLALSGLRRFGLVYLDDVGPANPQAMHDALAANKLAAVASVPVDRNSEDLGPHVAKLMGATPEAVLFITNSPPIVKIVRGMRKAVWGGRFASSSFAGFKMVEDLGVDAAGLIVSQVVPSPEKLHLKVVDDYIHDLRRHNPNAPVGFTGLEAYISARVMVEALRRVRGRLDVPNFIATLEAMRRFDLGGYEVSFSARSHDGSRFVDTGVVNREGIVRF